MHGKGHGPGGGWQQRAPYRPPGTPPPPGPLDAVKSAHQALRAWWHRAFRPAFWGCFGGFLVAMAVTAIGQLVYAALGGSGFPEWLNPLIVLAYLSGGAAIFYMVRQAAPPGVARHVVAVSSLSDGAIRAQAKRIAAKCRRMRRAAARAGGPYRDLAGLADDLARQAGRLAEQVVRLRRAARDVRRDLAENPIIPPGMSPDHPDPVLQQEFQAARATQQRLQDIIARNAMLQGVSLTRLERIEDLVDTARLEVSAPPLAAVPGRETGGIVEEAETELQAARAAIEEVEQLEA